MRRYARRAVAALAITVALAVTGCVATPGGTKPTPSPSATPLFHSDEEALGAAEEAYAAYLRVSDQILMDGGKKPERLLEVATKDVLNQEQLGYEKARTLGHKSTGGSTYDQMRIQDINADPSANHAVVTVYVCDDVSAVDIVDSNGKSVVSPERPDRFPTSVTFDLDATTPPSLIVASVDEWTGADFCN
jgi:hypothetical protein